MSSTTTSQEGSRLVIDSDNKAALIVMVSAVGLSWTLLTLIIRIVSKLHIKRTIGLEEILVIAASIAAGVSSACVLVSIKHGLGRRDSGIESEDHGVGIKLLWLSDLFYPITLGIAKIAALPLLTHLTRIRRFIVACYVLSIFTALWAFVSVLMVAARCHLSSPWNDLSVETCPSLYGRWLAVEVVSLIIEILIFVVFVSIIYILKMRSTVKFKVILAFATRLPIFVPTVFRLIYLRSGLQVNHDTTFALTNAIIATQTILHYTTMAASFAYLKPFLRAFDSNLGATVNVDTLVSSGGAYNDRSARASSASKEKGHQTHTPSFPLEPVRRVLTDQPAIGQGYIPYTISPTSRSRKASCSNAEDDGPQLVFPTSREYNNQGRALAKKYTSRESMMPMITKTQEWHVEVETRDQNHSAN